MSDPVFGISIIQVDNEARPTAGANMSIIGLVVTAPDADPTVYPYDEPVSLFSNDTTKVAKLGESGTAYQSIAAVNQQLGEFSVAAEMVIVRVEEGASVAETIANLRGDPNARTGMFALLDAPTLLGKTPRLVGVPAYTSQALNGLDEITVTNGGSGYTSVPSIGISGGGGTGAVGTGVLTNGVGSVTIEDGGEDYATAPTLLFSPPDDPAGIRATGTATVTDGAISAITITNKGKGYTDPPTASAIGGGGSGAVLTAVLTGILDKVVLDAKGAGFTSAPTIGITGGGGTGAAATATIDHYGNAICASLPAVLDQLLAHAVVDGPATTETAAINWRETISSRRIIPVDPAYKILDDSGDIIVVPKSPYILGLAVKVDHEHGGAPFHSWANRPINGIIGTSRPIDFSLLDGANEGQSLLAHNIGVTTRGETTDVAIADGGFVFVGTDTCSGDPLWQFYNQSRGRDYIHLLFIKALRFYLGRFNLTGQTIQALANTMNFALRDLKALNHILGYKVTLPEGVNSPEQLRLGRVHIEFRAEEPAPLRYIGLRSARYRPALDALLKDLMTQIDLAA